MAGFSSRCGVLDIHLLAYFSSFSARFSSFANPFSGYANFTVQCRLRSGTLFERPSTNLGKKVALPNMLLWLSQVPFKYASRSLTNLSRFSGPERARDLFALTS